MACFYNPPFIGTHVVSNPQKYAEKWFLSIVSGLLELFYIFFAGDQTYL